MKKGLSLRFKVAESVVAAEISDHLNAFSNISRRGTKINFYLSFSSLPLLSLPLKFISLSTSSLELLLTYSAAVLISCCTLQRHQYINNMHWAINREVSFFKVLSIYCMLTEVRRCLSVQCQPDFCVFLFKMETVLLMLILLPTNPTQKQSMVFVSKAHCICSTHLKISFPIILL